MKKQPDLFGNNEDNNDYLHRQLIKLGDMMGDGLHYEEPWIAKEYAKIAKLLMPEHFENIRKNRAASRDEKMKELLKNFKCRKCEGMVLQTRKGSKTAKCLLCNARYTATKGK